ELEEMRARERAGRAAIEDLRRRREALGRELESLLGVEGERRLSQQKRELARAELVRRAEEDFAVEPHALLEGFEPEAELGDAGVLDDLVRHVHALKSEMEKLGPVNLEAVTELE